MIRFLMMSVLLGASAHASAQDNVAYPPICDSVPTGSKAQAAAKIACDEYKLWGESFINRQGQLVNSGPMEGERDALRNGQAAWTRVRDYWADGIGLGYLYEESEFAALPTEPMRDAFVRARLIDNPWSAAFISYVMKRAGFSPSEFAGNDGHIRYIKPVYAASLSENGYAFVAQNPLKTPLAVGDLLCSTREGRDVYGVQGFSDWMSVHATDNVSLKMHCDLVVGIRGRSAFTIGGNVLQSVTMRELVLAKNGALSPLETLPVHLPQASWIVGLASSTEVKTSCQPETGANCNMNQKDWVVLLKAH